MRSQGRDLRDLRESALASAPDLEQNGRVSRLHLEQGQFVQFSHERAGKVQDGKTGTANKVTNSLAADSWTGFLNLMS